MPTDESAPLALQDPYTTTKILGEELCELFWRNHGISYAALRLFNAYGPGQSPDYFLGKKLAQAKAGGSVTLRNAKVTKDWVHVSDVVRAMRLALESEFVGAINIGTGTETSLEELATQIGRGFGAAVVPEPDEHMGPSRMCASTLVAERVLGWKASVNVDRGIADLIREAKEGS
jgi:UDP-glucose 4-epimerase